MFNKNITFKLNDILKYIKYSFLACVILIFSILFALFLYVLLVGGFLNFLLSSPHDISIIFQSNKFHIFVFDEFIINENIDSLLHNIMEIIFNISNYYAELLFFIIPIFLFLFFKNMNNEPDIKLKFGIIELKKEIKETYSYSWELKRLKELENLIEENGKEFNYRLFKDLFLFFGIFIFIILILICLGAFLFFILHIFYFHYYSFNYISYLISNNLDFSIGIYFTEMIKFEHTIAIGIFLYISIISIIGYFVYNKFMKKKVK